MIRSLFFAALTLAIMFASASCTTSNYAASGRKARTIGQFSYRINNNHVSKATVYKHYLDQSKNEKWSMAGSIRRGK